MHTPKYKLPILVTCLLAAWVNRPASLQAQNFTVITLNLRLDMPSDGPNAWDNRKEDVGFFVASRNPGLFCVQEGLIRQLLFLDTQLPGYRRIGVGRDDGKEGGEFSAIYYDTAVFRLEQERTFWLSDTPDTVSVGWDAVLPRVCTYGSFQLRSSGKRLHAFNTHFDHKGSVARERSAILILDRMKELALDPDAVILTGDLNATPDSRPVAFLRNWLTDGADAAPMGLLGPKGTWNGFDPEVLPDHRIDYIFVRNLDVVAYRNLDTRRPNGLWLSDHLPVRATLKLD